MIVITGNVASEMAILTIKISISNDSFSLNNKNLRVFLTTLVMA
jgi:hypothetical protein